MVQFQKSPSKFLELFDDPEEQEPETVMALFKIMRLMIKVSTIEQEFRNLMQLSVEEKKDLAKRMRLITKEVEELNNLEPRD